MSSGGFSAKTFFGSLLLVFAACFASARFGAAFLAEPRKPGVDPFLYVTLAGLAAGPAAVLTYLLSRWRRRFVERAAAQIRSAAGDAPPTASHPTDPELAPLSSAVADLRRRFAERLEHVDRRRLALAALVNQLREGVVVVNPDGRIALFNPAATRLLNLDPRGKGEDAFVGQPLERCIPQHDLQALARRELRTSAAAADPPSRGGALPWGAPTSPDEARLQVDSPTGSVHLLVHASDLALPDPEAGGVGLGRLLVLMDISELVRIVQIKTDFVANASHELRTPLSTIRASVETLLSMNLREDDSAARHFLTLVDRHSGRLEALVADLLDLARVESPAARFEMRPIDLETLLEELRERCADALTRKGLIWSADLSGCRQPSVTASPHLLNLVLDNLVDNAVKFTDRGGRVQVTVRDGPVWFSIEVADDGCGIPEADQERVFERFYQVERARSGPERGTGLGLSIVRHAVSAMNGAIALQSQPGKGTRFKVTIPQDQQSAR